jgi:hypothetical protein
MFVFCLNCVRCVYRLVLLFDCFHCYFPDLKKINTYCTGYASHVVVTTGVVTFVKEKT